MAKHKEDEAELETKDAPEGRATPPVPPGAGAGSAAGEPRVKMGTGASYTWAPTWTPGTPPVGGESRTTEMLGPPSALEAAEGEAHGSSPVHKRSSKSAK